MDARKYWDRFYSENPYQNGRDANEFIQLRFKDLPMGRVLDLGMGEGRNAIFLAKQGFKVEGLDISQVAIDRALALAYEGGVTIGTKRTDLDMHLFELMAFDAIIMTDFKPSLTRYYDEMVRSLKHGGRLLIEAALQPHQVPENSSKDSTIKYWYKPNELLHALKGLNILYYSEVDGSANNPLVRCLAEKPNHKDAQKFGMFDMQTKTASEPSIHLQMAESLFKK